MKMNSDRKLLWTFVIIGVFLIVTIGIAATGILLLNRQSEDSDAEEVQQVAEATPTERPVIIYDDEVFEDLEEPESENSGNTAEENTPAEEAVTVTEASTANDPNHPSFYGIWDLETEDLSEANDRAKKIEQQGMPAYVITTSDWENLAGMKTYGVTIGKYSTLEKAQSRLERVQSMGYPDTYVKYTGGYQGS